MALPVAQLRTLDPLPRWVLASASREGFVRAAPWLPALGLAALGTGVLLARFAPDAPRALCAAWLAGVIVPTVRARRRAARDPLPVVVQIDRRIEARACVLTAAEHALRQQADASTIRARVAADARAALDRASARQALPAWGRRAVALCGVMCALAMAGVLVRVPPRPARTHAGRAASESAAVRDPAVAAEVTRAADALESAARVDPAHANALNDAAREARALARSLAQGTARDDALARVDALEQAARRGAEWSADASARPAVDGALAALAREPEARPLADALATAQMPTLDRATRALADRYEARARRAAEDALAHARDAANRAGSSRLSQALEDERRMLARRGVASELTRAIADALARRPEGARVREALSGRDDEALRRALDGALRALSSELSAEERRQLAARVAEMAAHAGDAEEASREGLQRGASAPTEAELRQALRALLNRAREDTRGSTREGASGEAAGRGLASAQRARASLQLQGAAGGAAGPRGSGSDLATSSGGSSGGGAGGEANAGSGGGDGPAQSSGGAGVSEGGGHVASSGATRAIAGGGFTAPVRPARTPGAPAAGAVVSTEWTDPTGAHASAPAPETQLEGAAPAAMRGLDRAVVPRGYREQVRGYFGQR